MSIVLIQAVSFLVQSLITFYLGLILLRFLLQVVRANFYNPFCQFIVKLTNPPLLPLRRVIPGYRGLDFAALVLLLIIQMIQIYILASLTGQLPHFLGVMVLSIGELLFLTWWLYMFSLILQVLLSWVAPQSYRTPLGEVLNVLLEPIMRPARRVVPPISGIDLSPMLVILVFGLIHIVVINPITNLGNSML